MRPQARSSTKAFGRCSPNCRRDREKGSPPAKRCLSHRSPPNPRRSPPRGCRVCGRHWLYCDAGFSIFSMIRVRSASVGGRRRLTLLHRRRQQWIFCVEHEPLHAAPFAEQGAAGAVGAGGFGDIEVDHAACVAQAADAIVDAAVVEHVRRRWLCGARRLRRSRDRGGWRACACRSWRGA